MNKFFRRLNALYRKLKTWEAVAEYGGVNARSIRKWRNGERVPTRQSILNFA